MWWLMWLTLHTGVLLPTDRMSPRCSASIVNLERSHAGFECRCSKVLPMICVIPSSIWHDMDSPKASSLLGSVCHSTQVFLTHVSPTPGPLGPGISNSAEDDRSCKIEGRANVFVSTSVCFATKLLDFECKTHGSWSIGRGSQGLECSTSQRGQRDPLGFVAWDNLPRLQESWNRWTMPRCEFKTWSFWKPKKHLEMKDPSLTTRSTRWTLRWKGWPAMATPTERFADVVELILLPWT